MRFCVTYNLDKLTFFVNRIMIALFGLFSSFGELSFFCVALPYKSSACFHDYNCTSNCKSVRGAHPQKNCIKKMMLFDMFFWCIF